MYVVIYDCLESSTFQKKKFSILNSLLILKNFMALNNFFILKTVFEASKSVIFLVFQSSKDRFAMKMVKELSILLIYHLMKDFQNITIFLRQS